MSVFDQNDEEGTPFPESLTKALGSKKLLKHRDSDVKYAAAATARTPSQPRRVRAIRCLFTHFAPRSPSLARRLLAACCLSDLLRIFAPESPFEGDDADDIMRDVFELIISQISGVEDVTNPSYHRYAYVLERLAVVKSVYLVTELECDDLLRQLFETIFNACSCALAASNPRAAVPLSAPRGAAGHGGAPLRAWCDLLRRDRSARLFASLVVGGCPVRFSRPSPRAQAPNIPNRLGGDAVLAGQPRGQPVARVSPCLFRQEDDDGHLPRDGAIPRLGRQSPTVCAAQVCGPGEGSPWLAGFRGGHSPAGAV